jgi:hypothetical protein
MLTEIVNPETMPKNNRKIPKGQRFVIEALERGRGAGCGGRGENSPPLLPAQVLSPLDN